jgi:hypothetical protein
MMTAEPHEGLYRILDVYLADGFNLLRSSETDPEVIEFINTVKAFLHRVPVANIAKLFRHVNSGLAVWVGTEVQSKDIASIVSRPNISF